MLNVPEEVKELFKQDSTSKNFRVRFLNGEYPDLTNIDIESESVKFTESMSSSSDIKFGLAESSSLEFTCHTSGKFLHKIIEAGIEVYIDDYIHTDTVQAVASSAYIRILPSFTVTNPITQIRINFKGVVAAGAIINIADTGTGIWKTYELTEPGNYFDIPEEDLSYYTTLFSNIRSDNVQIQSGVSPAILFENVEIKSCSLPIDFNVHYREDIGHIVYYIPYGIFQIESSKRGDTPTIRQITAYGYGGENITSNDILELNDFEKAKYTLARECVYTSPDSTPQIGDIIPSTLNINLIKLCCSLFNSVDIIPMSKGTTDYSNYFVDSSATSTFSILGNRYKLVLTTSIHSLKFRGVTTPGSVPSGWFEFDRLGVYKIDYRRSDKMLPILNQLQTALERHGSTTFDISYILNDIIQYTYPYMKIQAASGYYDGTNYHMEGYTTRTIYPCQDNLVINLDGFDTYMESSEFTRDYFWGEVDSIWPVEVIRYPVYHDNYIDVQIPKSISFTIKDNNDVVIYSSPNVNLNMLESNLSVYSYNELQTSIQAIDEQGELVEANYPEYILPLYEITLPLKVTKVITTLGDDELYDQDYIIQACYINSTTDVLDTSNLYSKNSPFYNLKEILKGYLEINLLNDYINRESNRFKSVKLLEQLGSYPAPDIYPSVDLYPNAALVTITGNLIRSVWWNDEQRPLFTKLVYTSVFKHTFSEEEEAQELTGEYTIIESDEELYDLITYEIKDNFLLNRPYYDSISTFDTFKSKVLTILKYMATNMNTARYTQAKITMKGLPYIEIGDSIVILTSYSGFSTFLLRRTLSGVQSLTDTVEV